MARSVTPSLRIAFPELRRIFADRWETAAYESHRARTPQWFAFCGTRSRRRSAAPARVEEIGRLQAQLSDILGAHPVHPENLIALLQEIQQLHGYLSEEALRALAAASGISENEIYAVASFYTHFRFQPPAEHTIHVCQGTACHVRGGHQLLFDFEERLNIKAGQMTPDRRFGLERVACVGCCALAPVVLVDGRIRAGMKPKTVRGLLAQLGQRTVGALGQRPDARDA